MPEPHLPPAGDARRDEPEEHEHLHQRHDAVSRPGEDGRPGEQEHRVHREDQVQEREDVVPDVGLRPAVADRVEAAFVAEHLLPGGPVRAHQPVGSVAHRHEADSEREQQPDQGVGPQVLVQGDIPSLGGEGAAGPPAPFHDEA